ncbi:MAG TPA: DUF4390 domain-containing protein [Paenalcaligenes sp.]|nr:DUF4390 domain-containing protein [Paenalcaligenes sp.]
MQRGWGVHRLLMVLWVWLLGVGAMFPAQATERVDSVEIYAAKEQEAAAGDDGLYLDAEVDFDLSPELREAAAKGVPLYFTADLEIFEQRWWWFDKNILQAERTWKLVYSPLTRQWRIGSGDLLRPEESLTDALLALRRIYHWRIGDVSALRPDKKYAARFRLRLDSSLLARPFQVDLLNRANWSLETPWYDFQFSISAAKRPD